MLIRTVLSSGHTWPLLLPYKSSLRPVGPYSCTRHGWFRLPPIDQYSSLLPPVGVWTVSQFHFVGLVGRYPANCLMGREPIRGRRSFQTKSMRTLLLRGLRRRFHRLSPCHGHVAHALRTLPPVAARSIATSALPLDLHVLSLPLAFILSQDQTLLCIYTYYSSLIPTLYNSF